MNTLLDYSNFIIRIKKELNLDNKIYNKNTPCDLKDYLLINKIMQPNKFEEIDNKLCFKSEENITKNYLKFKNLFNNNRTLSTQVLAKKLYHLNNDLSKIKIIERYIY